MKNNDDNFSGNFSLCGTGIGLYGVKLRVDSLGGQCRAYSNEKPDVGSTFSFYIPYVVDNHYDTKISILPLTYNKQPSNHKSDIDISINNGKQFSSHSPRYSIPSASNNDTRTKFHDFHLSAVIIDDTKTVVKLMERMLKQLGIEEVVCCSDGSFGLEELKKREFDLVFCDIFMPIMMGTEVLLHILQFLSHHCYLIISILIVIFFTR